ncbi:MAG: alpha-L-fucosidase [Planctomycetes bacterium]|nr:alpha-L-fucosidase [Planctomycetota bacterium]
MRIIGTVCGVMLLGYAWGSVEPDPVNHPTPPGSSFSTDDRTNAGAPGPHLAIDATDEGDPISPYIYGQFIEHLGRCIYGGIWAEMIEDRKFFHPVGSAESPWQIVGPADAARMAKDGAFVGEHSPAITLPGGQQCAGIVQHGLALEAGQEYVGRVWLSGDASAAPVWINLIWGDGPGDRQAVQVDRLTADFARTALSYRPPRASEARLEITAAGAGAFRVGTVSLMPADNVDGMRADTLALLRELDAPVYRWPGGNFVSGYDWRDGVGDRDRRPPRKNPAWQGVEQNDFGLDEFMTFCRILGTEPYIALNTGLGTIGSAAAELEYANGAPDTTGGRLRAQNGHAEPYGVKFWGIGNEMYGDWQLGHVPLAEYTRRHNAYVDALRKVDPTVKVIGVGAVGEWSATMLRDCADHLDYLSEHTYWGNQPDLASHVGQARNALRHTADAHRRYRRELPNLKGRDIRICEDEWNYWYGPHVFGELGTRYFLKDALGCATALHEFARNSDLFFMANYAQTVNVIGAIKTSKTAAAFETTGLVLKLYRHHFGTVPVATHATPDIDAQAAWSADRRTLTIAIVNPSQEPLEVPLALHGARLSGGGRVWQIAGNDPLAFNDPDEGIKVRIEERAMEGIPGALKIAPCSVTLFALPTTAIDGSGAHSESTRAGPAPLVLAAPIERWDEALPLGNGCMGGLLWGGGSRINLSLDRGDLWDLRTPDVYQREDWNYATLKRLQDAGDQTTISKLFDEPYDSIPYPTKIPAGRLEIELDPGTQARTFTLDLQHATGHVETGHGDVECFYSATEPVALLRIKGRPASVRLVPPAALKRLGYAAAVEGRDEATRWFVQDGVEGQRFAVVLGSRTTDNATELALAIPSTRDGADPLAVGRQRVAEVLSKGYETLLADHRAWWRRFWSTSHVGVPDEAIQAHYDLVKHFYGAASRPDAPPMPLQGVWTADDGGLPPWKGDFHNDLNTQMTYLAYHTAGLTEAGESFVNFNWDLRPAYQRFAREFYDAPGLIVPGVMALDGQPLGGWSQYALSPTMGAWVAHSFYLHWRYTMDEAFLRERAYPWCADVGEALLALLKPDERGKLKLPLSSSPEIFDNSLRAWLPPNSNFDLALLRWLFGALAEMAEAAGQADAAQKWQAALADLDELDVEGAAGPLTFAHGLPYHESHRHFSHVMAIHPLGTLNIDGTDRNRAVVQASLDRILEKGTDAWCGYSFSWMACLLARCGRAEEALDHLKTYQHAFILRNGFHANGDQTRSGLSRFTYRPFTLEGNFLAMQAVHEMLLQSWGGVIRVFPAVSERWKDASFIDLRAEGAFRVSAQRENGRTVKVSVAADRGGEVRLRDPFGGESVDWNRPDVQKRGSDYEVVLERGAVLTGMRAAEALPRPTPEQAAWQDLELIAFAHFGINTFTDREWGDGTEDPRLFDPTHFDARQWVAALKPAGIKLLILTAKHHDGFCLWPSKYTEHSVRNSPWRDGRGDVVREVAQACREDGLKFGLYLSPWDRHENTYGDSPAYNRYFKHQLRELLSDYGDITEVWFDGACGEDPDGKLQEYGWAGFYQVIRELQPHALIAIMGPDIRWVGNESGLAREDESSMQPADPVVHAGRIGPLWYPAECDVSIRPGWFYHAKEDEQVKSLSRLMDIYEQSVGRNAVLLLNVPPDQRGLVHENDARRLAEFGAEIQRRFGRSVAETQGRGDAIELPLAQATTVDRAILMEDLTGGERVQEFVVEGWIHDRWEPLYRGQVIGHKRITRFAPVTVSRVRLRVLRSRAEPLIRKFAVYVVESSAQPASVPAVGTPRPALLDGMHQARSFCSTLSLLVSSSAR